MSNNSHIIINKWLLNNLKIL